MADFYLEKCQSGFLLKTWQIFISKNANQILLIKFRSNFTNKIQIWFYFEKETKRKITDLALNKKIKKTCKFDFFFFFKHKEKLQI